MRKKHEQIPSDKTDLFRVLATSKRFVLWGIPGGCTERSEEVLLLSEASLRQVEAVKLIAAKDGFHSFRHVSLDKIIMGKAPDFSATISRK